MSNELVTNTIPLETAQRLMRMGVLQKQTKFMWSKSRNSSVYHKVPQGFAIVSVDAYDLAELTKLAEHLDLELRSTDLEMCTEYLISQIKRFKLSKELKSFRL